MKPTYFVEGGGWVKREAMGRPMTRFFAILSLVWLVPSVLFVLALIKTGWPASFSDPKWLCILLPIPEPIFIVSAIVLAVLEKPKAITSHLPNPDYDVRKLY